LKLKRRFAIKKVLKEYKQNNQKFIEPVEELKEYISNGELTDGVLQILKGLEYAIKIFANSLYGAVRSSVFEQINSPNAGWDCCWIGQQIHEYVQRFFEVRGFRIIGGFTDSWFIEKREGYSREDIMKLAEECMNELKQYMPFPAESHKIGFECYIDYILYNYDKKKKEFKKNNYVYISEDKVKIVGFPIKKTNASKLSYLIFKKYLEKEGIEKKRLKFSRSYIKQLIQKELDQDIGLAAINIICNSAHTYKTENQLQAQVSRSYFEGLDGNIDLIKNRRVGRVGKTNKYCTIEEAKENSLQFNDLILTKVWNELEPFIINEENISGLNQWF
jgi:DNA polymerase elongation subunit (family B)